MIDRNGRNGSAFNVVPNIKSQSNFNLEKKLFSTYFGFQPKVKANDY